MEAKDKFTRPLKKPNIAPKKGGGGGGGREKKKKKKKKKRGGGGGGKRAKIKAKSYAASEHEQIVFRREAYKSGL